MSVMLERWNDDKDGCARVDDGWPLGSRVDVIGIRIDERFERIEIELRELRMEMKAGFDRLQRLMQFCGGLVVALFVALATHA